MFARCVDLHSGVCVCVSKSYRHLSGTTGLAGVKSPCCQHDAQSYALSFFILVVSTQIQSLKEMGPYDYYF